MGLMALITALVLCARSQDSLLSVLMRRVHVVFSTAGFMGGGKPRHVKPPRCGEASRKPRALSRVRTQAIDTSRIFDICLSFVAIDIKKSFEHQPLHDYTPMGRTIVRSVKR